MPRSPFPTGRATSTSCLPATSTPRCSARGWPALEERARRRLSAGVAEDWPGRCWEAISSTQPDPTLPAALEEEVRRQPPDAALHSVLGVAEALAATHRRAPAPPSVAEHF